MLWQGRQSPSPSAWTILSTLYSATRVNTPRLFTQSSVSGMFVLCLQDSGQITPSTVKAPLFGGIMHLPVLVPLQVFGLCLFTALTLGAMVFL